MSQSKKPEAELREPPPLDENANPVEAHDDYLRARLGGGAAAAPGAYQQALEQWHALRGAVRAPAAELTGPGGLPAASEEQPQKPDGECGSPRRGEIDDADNTS